MCLPERHRLGLQIAGDVRLALLPDLLSYRTDCLKAVFNTKKGVIYFGFTVSVLLYSHEAIKLLMHYHCSHKLLHTLHDKV